MLAESGAPADEWWAAKMGQTDWQTDTSLMLYAQIFPSVHSFSSFSSHHWLHALTITSKIICFFQFLSTFSVSGTMLTSMSAYERNINIQYHIVSYDIKAVASVRTYDAVHVEVGCSWSWNALSEWRQDVRLGHRIKDGDQCTVDARHNAVALHAELEVRRHWHTQTNISI